MVALVVVILDEGHDLAFKVAGEGPCCAIRLTVEVPLSPDRFIPRSQ